MTKEQKELIKTIVKKKMSEKEITAYRLSQLSDISESTLSKWFTGKRSLNEKNLEKILQALNIKLI